MSDTEFIDESGTTRLRGRLQPSPVANAIPQGGPLTRDLITASYNVMGGTDAQASLLRVKAKPNATDGADGLLSGGTDDMGTKLPASVTAGGATPTDHGALLVTSLGASGLVGQALVRKGATAGAVGFGGVQIAAAVPMGAPTGLPFAVDSTAVTGGLYVWDGANWIKVSTIP